MSSWRYASCDLAAKEIAKIGAKNVDLLLHGFFRRNMHSSSWIIVQDIIRLIYIFCDNFVDEWSQKHIHKDLKVLTKVGSCKKHCCVVRKEYSRNYKGTISYALGKKIIDTASNRNGIYQWRLKLTSRNRKWPPHLCCGIGIINADYKVIAEKKYSGRRLIAHWRKFERKQRADGTFYGWECVDYGDEHCGYRAKYYGHCINEQLLYDNIEDKKSLSKFRKTCFNNQDIVRLIFDVTKKRLVLCINEKKYFIKDMTKALRICSKFRLFVWLTRQYDRIYILDQLIT